MLGKIVRSRIMLFQITQNAMALILGEFTAPEHVCMYLPPQLASNTYKTMVEVTPLEFDQMLLRGWRRFGPVYFRPACGGCHACVSIRVPVEMFRPTKSQRRAREKASSLRLEIGSPKFDQERLELYQRWHRMREQEKGWQESPLTEQEYRIQFCWPHPCAREFAYYDGEKLVAVGYVDETSEALSSIYFFYEPDYASLSLGVASVLREIETARERGLKYLYLGFRVLGCGSMEYKMQFRPHELLMGRPREQDAPVWVPEKDFQESGPGWDR